MVVVRQPRVRNLLGALLAVVMLAGCTTTTGPTPAPKPDFTKPGAAADIVNQLMAQIGSTRVVRVRLTAAEAEVSVVSGTSVVTYAWRDNQISPVDTDVQYVGQALFDPREFNLANLGDLFDRAAAVAGSAQGQQLQVVDFDSGHIYMTVTTNPETMPVFFFPDGTLVATFDPANQADLAAVLGAVLPQTGNIVRLGVDTDGSVYADQPAGPGQILHVVRSPRFPVTQQLKTDGSGVVPFSPAAITAGVIGNLVSRAAAHTGKEVSNGFSVVIEQRAADAAPAATVVIGAKTVRLTLSGVILGG